MDHTPGEGLAAAAIRVIQVARAVAVPRMDVVDAASVGSIEHATLLSDAIAEFDRQRQLRRAASVSSV